MSARLRLLAVGTRMPGWVQEGFEDYRKRLPRDCALELREIALAHGARVEIVDGQGGRGCCVRLNFPPVSSTL